VLLRNITKNIIRSVEEPEEEEKEDVTVAVVENKQHKN
jgi:hypothetical protein